MESKAIFSDKIQVKAGGGSPWIILAAQRALKILPPDYFVSDDCYWSQHFKRWCNLQDLEIERINVE